MTIAITIRDKVVKRGHKKMAVDQFCGLVAQNCVTGMRDEPIPDHVKWLVERGDYAVYILELQPELRTVLWKCYDAEEDENVSKNVTIATPYVVLSVKFHKKKIVYGGVGAFYRNQPLQSIDDELFFTNLRNIVGTECQCPGYMCLDGLKYNSNMSRETILSELVNHLWSGQFNDDISQNGFKCFSQSGIDKRLASIESWQQASLADPSFVLDVDWMPAHCTVRGLIKQQFNQLGLGKQVSSSTALGNLILAGRKQSISF